VSVCEETSTAAVVALRNWDSNLRFLEKEGQDCYPAFRADLEFVYGRDGTLTARTAGDWYRNCSVPKAAAIAQLRDLAAPSSCVCILDPAHPAVIRLILERFRPSQAVVVVVPSKEHFSALLCFDDLSEAIQAGRLLFAWGCDWQSRLATIFNRHTGLAIPGQFIRLEGTTPLDSDALIAESQPVFAAAGVARQRRLDGLCQVSRSSRSGRLLLVAGKQFRLWSDPTEWVSAEITPHFAKVEWFDTDSPLAATPLALAEAAQACDALLAMDEFRPESLPPEVLGRPWITWVSQGLIPKRTAANCSDSLVVADKLWAERAAKQDWERNRVGVGTPEFDAAPPPHAGTATMICDLPNLRPAADLEHFSSLRLLWESLYDRLSESPFDAIDRADEVVAQSMRQLQIDPSRVSLDRFSKGIVPAAFAVGLVRQLLQMGVPLRLYGDGWQQVSEAASVWNGPVKSRESFRAIINSTHTLIHSNPSSQWHPIDAYPRRVIRGTLRGLTGMLADLQNPAAPSRVQSNARISLVIRDLMASQVA